MFGYLLPLLLLGACQVPTDALADTAACDPSACASEDCDQSKYDGEGECEKGKESCPMMAASDASATKEGCDKMGAEGNGCCSEKEEN